MWFWMQNIQANFFLIFTRNDGGKIYLEIGYKQGQSVPALFMENLPEKQVRTLKDQFGQDRMVVIDDGEN